MTSRPRWFAIAVVALACAACSQPLQRPAVSCAPGVTAGLVANVHLSTAAPALDEWVVAVDPRTASASRPVLWFSDVTNGDFTAYDWSGHAVGSLHADPETRFGETQRVGILQSPDGTAVVVTEGVVTAGGHVIGRTAGAQRWARDSQHLCSVLGPGGAAYPASTTGALFIENVVGQATNRVATFGAWNDNSNPALLACSVPDGRAIVGEAALSSLVDVSAITLSNPACGGAPGFATQPVATVAPASVVASADGRLIAVGTALVPNQTAIRAVDTGATLARLPGPVVSFTDDGANVVTMQPGTAVDTEMYSLINWHSGKVLWKAELAPASVVTRPRTGDVLMEPVMYRPVPGTNRNQSYSVPIVVHTDGSTLRFSVELPT